MPRLLVTDGAFLVGPVAVAILGQLRVAEVLPLLGKRPDLQPCDEITFTRRIAQACVDYASTRRYLVEDRLMQRDGGLYRLTAVGEVAWRVERLLAACPNRSN
jgi:hypothetical protein